jgi:integrase
MPSPYKHQTTGIYWLKQRVPARLVAVAKGQAVTVMVDEVPSVVKLGEYIKVSLRTKDPAEAKRRSQEAETEFSRIWLSFENGPVSLSLRQITALCGEMYHTVRAVLEDDPGEAAQWAQRLRDREAVYAQQKLTWRHPLMIGPPSLEARLGSWVDGALAEKKLRVDEKTRQRCLVEFDRTAMEIALLLERRGKGDFSKDEVGERFPKFDAPHRPTEPTTNPSGATIETITLTSLLAHKQQTQTKKDATFKSYLGCLKRFIAFVGHEDASRITKDDARRWRDELIKSGLAKKTINDQYLTSLKVVLNHGVKEFDLPVNVAASIRDERDDPAPVGSKGYSEEQAHAILEATFRGSVKSLAIPYQRAIFWVPWICAYTGLRVSEVTQFQGRHLREENGIPYLFISPEDGSTKGKNAWTTGVHQHLIDLGLLDMLRSVGDGPAFYTPYPEGTDLKNLSDHRAKSAGDKIAEWVREEVGIAPPGNRPSHAWRHLFTTLSRTHTMDKEARDYMMGSRSKTDAREGYGDWPPEVVDVEVNKLPRFEVMETAFRPSVRKVAAQPLKNLELTRIAPRTRKPRAERP